MLKNQQFRNGTTQLIFSELKKSPKDSKACAVTLFYAEELLSF